MKRNHSGVDPRIGAPSAFMTVNRRNLLMGGLAFGLAAATPPLLGRAAPPDGSHAMAIDPLLDDIQERTFRFFWETTNPKNGLARDRYPSPSASSIAAVGFALTAYPIGVERGYITRAQARDRVLATCQFFHDAPQGGRVSGQSGFKGFFYHFIDMETGHRAGVNELSTVDTALLICGMLFCQSYFDQDHADEVRIRGLIDEIYARIDWRWAQIRKPSIVHGWMPESGYMDYDWRGYNEAMIVYLLALGSPTWSVDVDAWDEWTSTYDECWGVNHGVEEHLGFAPLFGHQYSHLWIDFRDLRDSYMRKRGIDYFENNRRAIHAQRAYAIANPEGWAGYGEDVWGITASDGPGVMDIEYGGRMRKFHAYMGRGAGGASYFDDGTIAPTAAIGSLPFAPDIVIPAMKEMHRRYGTHIYSDYGFLDSFNPSFEFDVPLQHGRVIDGFGWVATDYIGIDQGPILAMIENHRTGLVWEVMRKNKYLRRGLERAGFSGGWIGETA
jgi:hypothetical protein